MLRRRICGGGCGGRRRHDAIHRRSIDNGAAERARRVGRRALRQHLADLRALAQPHAFGVDGNDALKIGEVDFRCGLDGAADAGVVDGVVDAAEFLDGLRDAVVHGGLRGHVGFDRLDGDVWVVFFQLRDGGCERVAVEEREGADALAGEDVGGVLTDSWSGRVGEERGREGKGWEEKREDSSFLLSFIVAVLQLT